MLLTANIFQPLIDVFEAVIKFFHNTVGVPWGWSIVLLTVVIRLLLVPLMFKQFHSMQALQRLQPELKALQSKYKDDKQRQQQEMMKFYKENNVNPMASCLPMAAQLPVFISLFYMLREDLRTNICRGVQIAYQKRYAFTHHVSMAKAASQTTACGAGHGAGFLFISDLTNKPHGLTLAVLALLYVGTQLASTMLMATPTMDKTQRQMMMVMPVFFVIFVFRFPSGVLVYWITTNTWQMAQQYAFRRRIGIAGGPQLPTAGAAAGAPDGDGKRAAGSSARRTTRAKTADGKAAGAGAKGSGANGDRAAPTGASAAAAGNGAAGIGARLRGRVKEEEEPAPVKSSGRSRGAAPPPPPRKKKKRSGRRR